MDAQIDGRHGHAHVARHGQRGLPDQVVNAGGDIVRVAALGFNRKLPALAKAAFQVEAERETQRIETGSEVGARGRYAERSPGHHVIA